CHGVTDRAWIMVQISERAQLRAEAFQYSYSSCSLVASVAEHVVVLGVGVEAVHRQARAGVAGVSNLAVTDIHGDVGDSTVAVEHQVTGLQLVLGDFLGGGVLCCRGPRDALAVLAQGLLGEAGAIPLVSFSIGAQSVAGTCTVRSADGPGCT